MILGTLSLTNFGVYAGTQSIDLAPADRKRPIILIGGLNGSGKTSLLTAIRIALFGKRSIQFHKEQGSYERLLRRFVHDNAQGEASVALSFATYNLGEREDYGICRSWKAKSDGKVQEQFEATRNGLHDQVLTTTWDDFIDALLPASIAHLFFFDGETVGEMANAEGAQSLLRTGVSALLGIDMLDRLNEDLAFLIQKRSKESQDSETKAKLASLEQDLQDLARQKGELESEKATADEELAALTVRFTEADNRLKETGASLFLERKSLGEELQSAKTDFEAVQAELVELAAGPLPLALVPDLLADVREQDQKEQQALQSNLILDVLEQRDEQILSLLTGTPEASIKAISSFLQGDREKRKQLASEEVYLHLTPEAQELLSELDEVLKQEISKAGELVVRYEQAEERLRNAERKLAMVPPEANVADVIQQRVKVQKDVQAAMDRCTNLAKKVEQNAGIITFRQAERDRIIRRLGAAQVEGNEGARIVRYANKARTILDAFSGRVLERAISNLEELILKSLEQLLRKEDYITGLHIDRGSFALTLRYRDGQELDLDRLSAGESQLVIIAILWGLKKASGRPLPVIIDTPLGRLDSHHRDNLLQNYFPDVSHQVVLLSTDTEVVKEDLPHLQPYLDKSFALEYDSEKQVTTITQGYFHAG
ncbi:DNA sulfur modification protein DndD [Desulfocurvibacter africanus]|uniref:DNA sulfur modification protein DndD n=1 Tax=Desulfocurvibacter africanus subsp. africanus str. Walvis Bay TaxID=690850 RepID=F3YZA0_DESAF|nr:DNA sulfur modification protein DndD [Desulfocurvibacter africanus]EGJ50856.1 DNA sulfur modification protein DndD [Desulfocurvibacter africanus subsp. africanus str. Walvis Bay]